MPPPSHPTKFIQIAAGTLGILYALDDTGEVWIWVPTIASARPLNLAPPPAAVSSPDIHVVPLNDSAPHRDDGTPCWCGPDYLLVGGTETRVVVHHSADGRELLEAHRGS